MSSGHLALHRLTAIILLAFAHWAHATPANLKSASPLTDAFSTGTYSLNGPCQFHPGDDLVWANPAFDDSRWERLRADRPWGKQGHGHLTGMAWYRCPLAFAQAPATDQELSLLIPQIHDSYEIYWNGKLIGSNGKLPPHPVWYISQPMQIYKIEQMQRGILAIRVWKAPLLSDDSGERGGFDAAPLIGSSEAIATAKAAYNFHWLRTRQLHFATNLLCAVLGFLSFLLWLGTPRRRVLLWTAGFAIAQPAILLLVNAHLGLPYPLAMGAAQPLHAIQDVSLWFLLLLLLGLYQKQTLRRITWIFAGLYTFFELSDGILVASIWNPHWTATAQVCDAVLTSFSVLFEIFPVLLLGYALFRHKQFDSVRWLLATLAFIDEMMLLFRDTVKQGRQFTGWSIADKIDSPLFFMDGNGISLTTLAGTLLLVTIVYAVYNSIRQDQRRQDALEREKLELLNESSRMRHHAEHDGLTGLLNRRVVIERLREEMIRSFRDGTPMSVILADVDHFKKVNDNYGHLFGDLVLKEIGSVFARTLRPYDYVGRYGGEEFLLILPNCEIDSVLLRAEQLRAAVQAAHIVEGDASLYVTASFGVAPVLPSHSEAEAVIRAADLALYRAKSSGRNCVIQADMDDSLFKSVG